MDHELRVLRDRHEGLEDDVDRADRSPPDSGRALFVMTIAPESLAGVFRSVVEVDIDGDETEGSQPTLTARDPAFSFPALHQGLQAPKEGTYHVARLVGGKWVFRYDG